jgi:hypothetical protein
MLRAVCHSCQRSATESFMPASLWRGILGMFRERALILIKTPGRAAP